MGNKQSQILKNNYMEEKYKVILEHNDFQLGSYCLFRFHDEKVLYLKKEINPSEYDDFTCDWNMFETKVFSKCENLCELKFFVTNKANEEIYDIIFEFGNYINTNLNNEGIIWNFINDMLQALLFLQHQDLYYPLLRKRYTVFVSENNKFKILSPYAFSNFMKDAITLFFNPNIENSQKKEVSQKNINRNVKEFGIMILALIHNVEDVVIYKNPFLIRKILNHVKENFSVKLYDFLSFTIETKDKITFTDLEHFLLNYEKLKISQIQRTNPEPKSPRNFIAQIQTTDSPKKIDINVDNSYNMSMTVKKSFSPVQQKTPILNTDLRINSFEDLDQQATQPIETMQLQKKFDQINKVANHSDLKSQFENINGYNKENDEQKNQKETHLVKKEKDSPLENTPIQSKVSDNDERLEKDEIDEKKKENPKLEIPTTEKKIKRIVVKWIQEENCSREFIEFEDGSLIEKNPDPEQVKNIMNNYYKTNNLKKPDLEAQRKAEELKTHHQAQNKETFDINALPKKEAEQETKETKYLIPRNDEFVYDINKKNKFEEIKIPYIITLNTGEQDKTKKILTSKISFFKNCYDDLKTVVNFDSQLKPSIYHQVD